MRRNIMRYMVLSFVITLMRISLRVKKRFPSWQHLVDSGKSIFLKFFLFRLPLVCRPMNSHFYWLRTPSPLKLFIPSFQTFVLVRENHKINKEIFPVPTTRPAFTKFHQSIVPFRTDAWKWKKDFRNNGSKKSNVQVLDAIGVGNKYHQHSPEAGADNIRPHCTNSFGWTVRY